MDKDNDPKKKDKTGSTRLALFLSTFSSIAIIGLLFFAYHFYKQSQSDTLSINTLLAQAKQSIGELETIKESNKKEKEVFKTLQKELEDAQSRFVTLQGNRDWVLSEVNYLVFMANEKLQTAKDITTAVAQLKVADQRLSTLADPSLLAVKMAIANDIAKLLNVAQVDKQALWAQVGSLSDLIAKLQFKILGTNQKTDEKKAFTLSSWQIALHQSWDEVKNLIKITRIEDNPIPIAFTQEEQAQILRTLQLLNEQAQWAVLQGDSKIYVDSLSTLDKYVKSYFIDNSDQLTLTNRIQELQQQPINIAIPDISNTLQALSQALASKKE